MIKGTCEFVKGSPSPYVTIISNLKVLGLVDVEITFWICLVTQKEILFKFAHQFYSVKINVEFAQKTERRI